MQPGGRWLLVKNPASTPLLLGGSQPDLQEVDDAKVEHHRLALHLAAAAPPHRHGRHRPPHALVHTGAVPPAQQPIQLRLLLLDDGSCSGGFLAAQQLRRGACPVPAAEAAPAAQQDALLLLLLLVLCGQRVALCTAMLG
jgi:hypothetical protein